MTVQKPIGVLCSQKQDFWKMSVCISKASLSTNWFKLLQIGHSNYFVKISKNKNIVILFLYG